MNDVTKLSDLYDAEVIGDFVESKYVDAIRLSPLAVVNNTLSVNAGSTISLPSYMYSGDASEVAEGEAIPVDKITMSTEDVKVSKIGKAVSFTDEAQIMSIGDIQTEAAKQILVAINSKVETGLLANMSATAVLTANVSASGDPADAIADALLKFGEDIDGEKVLVIPPSFYTRLLKSKAWIPNTEIGADTIVRGVVGMVHGCQIITSDRLSKAADNYVPTVDKSVESSKTYYEKDEDGSFKAVESPTGSPIALGYYERQSIAGNEAFIIKPGALGIFSKRGTLVEADRDILREIDVIKGSKIFAPYVYDKKKLIKLTIA